MTANNRPAAEPSGILVINKTAGGTSHDVVNAVRRLYSIKRVGHTGTLDPMATGVLVVLVGRAAKASEYAVSSRKSYTATLRLGLETDTEDITGNTVAEYIVNVTPDEIDAVTARFRGGIMQVPPMYSALKIGGRKLYDIARAGETAEREARPVTVYRLECAHIRDNDYRLDVECSAGTYIRTLCADIGRALGCGGVMASLERTAACGFTLDGALTLERLAALTPEERTACLLPVERLFDGLDEIRLPGFFEKLFRSGCEVYFKKLGIAPPPDGTRLRICDADGNFFALGECGIYDGGAAVKSVKLFVL